MKHVVFQAAPDLYRAYFRQVRAELLGLVGVRQFVPPTQTETILFDAAISGASTTGVVNSVISQKQAKKAQFREVQELLSTRDSQLNPWYLRAQQMARKVSRALGILLIAGSVVVGTLAVAPEVYYRIFPADTQPIEIAEMRSAWGGVFGSEAQAQQAASQAAVASTSAETQPILPPKNESLPEGNWISIPRIGVRTELQKTSDVEAALQEGVWWSPDYGQPGQTKLPMIVAAHRFGWDWWWQSDYWEYNSFYKLPELEAGDMVEVIVDQRKYYYEIYDGNEGQEITDYEADLILYTCKFLNSPVRHFRYARLIELRV